jgi:RHS repeat-associated protein
LTDFVGAIVELYSFDAYGNAIGFDPSVVLTEFLYSGEQFDSKIGQQYLRARYYDPATGRFNRLDPFFGNLNDPQSLHKYLYTHANPISGIDPSGRSLAGVSISIAIGAGLGALVGGAFSYYDTLLGGGTHTDALGAYWEGFKMGAFFGAILGPLHYLAIEARGIIQILGIVGALGGDIFLGGLGLVGTVESFVNGQWQQGLFRGTTTIVGTWIGVRGIAKAKLNTKSKTNTHESLQELHGAVRNLADEADSLYGEVNVYLANLDKHSQPARIGAARDTITGMSIAKSSAAPKIPKENLPADCIAMCEPFGGYGAKITVDGKPYTVGWCWEFQNYATLKMNNNSLTPKQVQFTQSYLKRYDRWSGPCSLCQQMFSESTFIPNPGN